MCDYSNESYCQSHSNGNVRGFIFLQFQKKKEKRKRKEKKRKEKNDGWYNSYLGNICQILVYQVHPGPLLSLVESLQERLGPALEVFDK